MKRTIWILVSLATVATAGCFAHSTETPNGTSSGVNVLGIAGYTKSTSKREYKECLESAPETSPDIRPWIDPCRQYTTAGAPGARPPLVGQLGYDPLLASAGYGMGGYGYGMNPYLIPAPYGRHELTGTMFDPVQTAYAMDRGVTQQAAANTPSKKSADGEDAKIYFQVQSLKKDVADLGEGLNDLEGRVEDIEKDEKPKTEKAEKPKKKKKQ